VVLVAPLMIHERAVSRARVVHSGEGAQLTLPERIQQTPVARSAVTAGRSRNSAVAGSVFSFRLAFGKSSNRGLMPTSIAGELQRIMKTGQ
jgi:hypothetical protein